MASSLPPGLPAAPNPLTPLAWLPPDIAFQFEIERFLVACVTGAWLCDVVMSFTAEYFMFTVKRTGFKPSDFAYIMSRITTGGFIITTFAFLVTPVRHCNATIKVASWFVAFALPLNSLLFYLRARGVFFESKLAVWAFFALWLTTFASITAPFAFEATQLGPTNWCVNTVVKDFSAASFVTVAFFDTLVFFAISIQVSLKRSGDWRARMKSFFTGKGIGRVSTALLQTGQLYYMVTVGLNIATMALLLTPSISMAYQGMLTVPNVALQNAMACRVFRLLKLGIISDDPANPTVPSIIPLSSRGNGNIRFASGTEDGGNSDSEDHIASFNSRRSKSNSRGPIRVTIQQETTTDTDMKETKDRDSVNFEV